MTRVTLPYQDSISRAWNAGGKEFLASAVLAVEGVAFGWHTRTALFTSNIGVGPAADYIRFLGQWAVPGMSLAVAGYVFYRACRLANNRSVCQFRENGRQNDGFTIA